jgi:hypothetical protein
MSLDEFRQNMVDPFADDAQRLRLFLRLEDWIAKLRVLKVSATLWLDGSFVTSKFGPSDIDCMMWNPTFLGSVSKSDEGLVKGLVDRATARSLYGLDLYMETPKPLETLHRQAYWRGMFGFQHSGVDAKGFVELAL